MKIEIYRDAAGEFRWRLKARNGRVVADGGEGYKRKSALYKALFRICDAYVRKAIVEVGP